MQRTWRKTGSLVRLVSPFWSIKITCTRYDVKANELYLPMNSTDNETAINFLTVAVDVRTNTPAYKQTKVRMEVLEVDGENPMPKANPRNKTSPSSWH